MSPEAQSIAIAEWCGWKWKASNETAFGATQPLKKWHDPQGKSSPFPDYLNDLNAMWEAEEKLTDHSGYWQQLEWIIGVPLKFSLCHATAAKRAEALLKTIGKWKET